MLKRSQIIFSKCKDATRPGHWTLQAAAKAFSRLSVAEYELMQARDETELLACCQEQMTQNIFNLFYGELREGFHEMYGVVRNSLLSSYDRDAAYTAWQALEKFGKMFDVPEEGSSNVASFNNSRPLSGEACDEV